MRSVSEKHTLTYKGQIVKGKKLIISSELNIDITQAWNEVQKSSLLEFICKGKVKFRPLDPEFPKLWKKDMVVKANMLIYGLIPFGRIHSIRFEEVDAQNFLIITNERNSIVKIWNHKINLKKIDANSTQYTDEIEIYAGALTNFIAKWAESFYKHRQKRWKIIVHRLKNECPIT